MRIRNKKIPLTQRQLEILTLISYGVSNPAIAIHLSLSTRTVETHRKNMIKKLNAFNICQVLGYAFRNNLFEEMHRKIPYHVSMHDYQNGKYAAEDGVLVN